MNDGRQEVSDSMLSLAQLQPHAWISRVALSGHFVQIFALPQVIAMIEKFLESGITARSDLR
ncbi:MAG: hypothetical protein WCA06_15755 [Terrimicrobiaceae bacterium]